MVVRPKKEETDVDSGDPDSSRRGINNNTTGTNNTTGGSGGGAGGRCTTVASGRNRRNQNSRREAGGSGGVGGRRTTVVSQSNEGNPNNRRGTGTSIVTGSNNTTDGGSGGRRTTCNTTAAKVATCDEGVESVPDPPAAPTSKKSMIVPNKTTTILPPTQAVNPTATGLVVSSPPSVSFNRTTSRGSTNGTGKNGSARRGNNDNTVVPDKKTTRNTTRKSNKSTTTISPPPKPRNVHTTTDELSSSLSKSKSSDGSIDTDIMRCETALAVLQKRHDFPFRTRNKIVQCAGRLLRDVAAIVLDPDERERICNEAMATIYKCILKSSSRLGDPRIGQCAQQFLDDVCADIRDMIINTGVVKEGYDGLDSTRDTIEQVLTALRFFPQLLSTVEARITGPQNTSDHGTSSSFPANDEGDNNDESRGDGGVADGPFSSEQERAAEAAERATSFLRDFDDEEQVIIFEALWGEGPTTSIVAELGTDTVQRSSMRTLQPGMWLNDEIIHYFFVMLAERDEELCRTTNRKKRSHFFKSFLITGLLNEGSNTNDGEYQYQNRKRWSKKVPGKDIFALDKIFFLINMGNMHWVCAVIFMQKKRIEMFDSMGSKGRRYLEALFQYLQDEHLDKKKTPLPDMDKWKLVSTQPETPRQKNGTFPFLLLSFCVCSLSFRALFHIIFFCCRLSQHFFQSYYRVRLWCFCMLFCGLSVN